MRIAWLCKQESVAFWVTLLWHFGCVYDFVFVRSLVLDHIF